MKIKGKVAVVIGGASGIGEATCRDLVAGGAKVCLGDVAIDLGQEVTRKLNQVAGHQVAIFRKCDITQTEDIKELFQCATEILQGVVEIVINTAGIVDEANFEHCINVNLVGTIRLTCIATEAMSRSKGGNGGVVVHIASVQGYGPGPGSSLTNVYCATKHGIVGYVRTFVKEDRYKEHGVRCNCVCPTAVDTPIMDVKPQQFCNKSEYEEWEKLISEFRSSGICLLPRDVSKALLQMVEDDSLNGQVMTVNRQDGTFFPSLPEPPPQ